MTRSELDLAIRRAFNSFDRWNDQTGWCDKGCTYYWELMSVIEDAVHCGAQAACGEFRTLEEVNPNDTQYEVDFKSPDQVFVDEHKALLEKKKPS